MGEDVGRYGGCFAVSKGLLDEFGEEESAIRRCRNRPSSARESALRWRECADRRDNDGQLQPPCDRPDRQQRGDALPHVGRAVPGTGRDPDGDGGGRQLAAQHSHSLEAWYAHVPGLRVVEPATIDDARGMLRPALESPDPVIIFEPISLSNMEGELTEEPRAWTCRTHVCTGRVVTSRWSPTARASGAGDG